VTVIRASGFWDNEKDGFEAGDGDGQMVSKERVEKSSAVILGGDRDIGRNWNRKIHRRPPIQIHVLSGRFRWSSDTEQHQRVDWPI
jgi:hypothetical protein